MNMGHSDLERLLLGQQRDVESMWIQRKGVIQDVIAGLEQSRDK